MSGIPDGHSAPPEDLPGVPVIVTIPKGSILFRIHSSAYTGAQFKPVGTKSPYKGGRFDSRTDGDPYLYAGQTEACAIAEVWDRDLGTTPATRIIPRSTLKGRELSQIRTIIDLSVIDVSVPAASQFGQTVWFTNCGSHEYEHTRYWAEWLRTKAPTHAGFRWRSRRNQDRYSYIFFQNQISAKRAFEVLETISVERGRGRALVGKTMGVHNAVFGRKTPP
jgi:hypothetical protein